MNSRPVPSRLLDLFQLQDASGEWCDWPLELPQSGERAEALALAACQLLRGPAMEIELGYGVVCESGERWGAWHTARRNDFVRMRLKADVTYDISRVRLRRRTVRDESPPREEDWAPWRCHPDAGWFARMALLWLRSGQERFRIQESECFDSEYSHYVTTETEVEESLAASQERSKADSPPEAGHAQEIVQEGNGQESSPVLGILGILVLLMLLLKLVWAR